MSIKELFTPVFVVGLSLAFTIVTLAVSVSKGKSKKWIARKMKIGGLLLSLTVAISSNGQEIEVTCYEPAKIETDVITIKEIGSDKSDYDQLRQIKGFVESRRSDIFSFCLINYLGTKVYSNNIEASDGKFDSPKEDFIIHMPNKLPEGQYILVIYNDGKNNQRTETQKHKLVISL